MKNLMTNIKSVVFSVPVMAAILVIGTYRIGLALENRTKQKDAVRTTAICPALLSISRSARDTLIVMKAEPLCNGYVLDNLK